MFILATPGPPVDLQIDQEVSTLSSHVALGSEVGADVTVRAIDRMGNACYVAAENGVKVLCRLVPLSSGDVTDLILSGSETSSDGNALVSTWGDGRFRFPSIVLAEKPSTSASEPRSGLNDAGLSFECQGWPLSSCVKKIQYYSNEAQARQLQEKRTELDALLSDIKRFEDSKAELQNELDEKDRELQELVMELSRLSDGVNLFSQEESREDLTQESYREYLHRRENDFELMRQAASQSRAPVRGPDYENNQTLSTTLPLSVPSAGLVVDLGYVMEEGDARVLSWAAQSHMMAAVVYSIDDMLKLVDSGCAGAMIIDRR